MNAILAWVKQNPTRAVGVVGVLIGMLGLIVPVVITTGLTTMLGIVTGTVVWNSVTPVVKSPPPGA